MRAYILIALTLIGAVLVADEAQAQRRARVVYSTPTYYSSGAGYYDTWGNSYYSGPTVRYSTSYYAPTYSTYRGYYSNQYYYSDGYYSYPSSRYYSSSPGYYGPNMYINERGMGGRGYRVRW